MRRAKARWVRVFPPAGNEKSSDKDRCFCAHRPDPREAHAPLRSFARVGLLTDAFRGHPQRARPAFSPRHYSSSNDPLSQRASPRANKRSAITATKPKACRLRSHVRDLHPIPLFSRTRSACPGLPGSRSCHKSCVFDCDIRCISTGRAPGSCPIVRPCAGACPASPVPDWPFSARP